jgi:hypothetical protein
MRSSVEFREPLVNMVDFLMVMVRVEEVAARMPTRVRHFDRVGV